MTNWQEKMGKKPQNKENSHDDIDAQNKSEFPKNKTENDQEGVQNQENNQSLDQNEQNLSETDILEQKLIKEQEKSAMLNDKLLRTLAEIENVRRRAKEDVEKTSNYAISGFVSDLVVVAENFFMACENMPKKEMDSSAEVKNFVIGVDMTKKELMKILEKNKVMRVFPLGENFDHNLHEAISQVDSEEQEGKVVQVIQAGYKIGNRLIRPALVGVSKGK